MIETLLPLNWQSAVKDFDYKESFYGGERLILRFENDYGASIFKYPSGPSGTSAEIGILKFTGKKITSYHLTDSNPFNEEVIYASSVEELEAHLGVIARIKKHDLAHIPNG